MDRPVRSLWLLWLIAATVFVVTSLSTIVLWRLQSTVQLLAIPDDTMQPTLTRDDAVIVRVGLPADLKPGDIVSFRDPSHPGSIATRRIRTVDEQISRLTVESDDIKIAAKAISRDALIGKVELGLPKLGYVFQKLQSPLGIVIGTYVPAFTILLIELRNLKNYYGLSAFEQARLGFGNNQLS